jgi:AAA family ATP:ADP antiporter
MRSAAMTPSRSSSTDRQAATAATFAAFLLIAQQVAARAVRDALFLSAFQVKSLPLVMGGAAVFALAGAEVLSIALARRSPSRVVPAAAALSAGLFALWWAVGLVSPRAAAVGVYLHVATFGGALVSGFWSLVNERFDPYTLRKAVGPIGTGATAGGVAGGLLAWIASRTLPLPATVLGLVAVSALAAAVLARTRGKDPAPPATPAAAPGTAAAILLRTPSLRTIALVVGLGAVVEALVDFLFKAEAVGRFDAGGSLLGAFAVFHGGMSVLSLVAQASASRAALRHLGIAGTLALRPALTAASALLGVALPRFATATLARGAHETLTNSLFRSAYELLYTPLPEAEKRRAKAVVDVAVDKLGALLGSGTIALALALVPAAAASVLFAVAAAGSLAALGLSRRLHRGYVRTLEQSLILGRVRLDADEILDQATQVTLANTSLIERGALLRQIEELRRRQLGSLVSPPTAAPLTSSAFAARDPSGPAALVDRLVWAWSGHPDLVRQALRHSPEPEPALVACLLPHLASEELFVDVVRALRRASPRVTGQLVDALLDPAGDPTVRRRIPRVLKACPTDRTVEGLRAALEDPSFEIRASAAAALAALHESSPVVRIAREEVLGRVRRELDSGETVDRQLPQLFALLSLTLERGPLQIAWAAMKGQDRTLRGTALEYLANVLPDDVFPRIRSCFGASTAPLPSARRPVEQVADELRASSVGLRIDEPPWGEGGES